MKRLYACLLIIVSVMALYGCRASLVNAILSDQTETAKLLIDQGADVNEKGRDNFTPLHWAAYYGKAEMARILLNKGAQVNAMSETYGTPLILAAQYEFTDTVRVLLEKGADVTIKDASGRTALSHAEATGNAQLIQLLKKPDTATLASAPPPAAPGKVVSAEFRSDAEKSITVEKPAKAIISRGLSRINVSVFYFTPLNMEASSYGVTATNILINALKMEPSFVMLDRKDLETFLAINDLQQNDEMENVVNIGTRMALNFVVAGNVEKKGSLIITNCKVISIDQRKVIFTKRYISTGEANLVSDFGKLSSSVIEAIIQSAR
jgi:ankyrin repeat protein